MINRISEKTPRRHPGGWQARLKWVKWILGYGLITSVLVFVFSWVILFSEEQVIVPVIISADVLSASPEGGEMNMGALELTRGDYRITEPTLLDKIVLDHPQNRLGWYQALFWMLICWFLIRILNDLDFRQPFQYRISNRIRYIAVTFFTFTLIYLFRWAYALLALRGERSGMVLDTNALIPGLNGYVLMAIMLSLVAYIYHIGCKIQEDRDLTI